MTSALRLLDHNPHGVEPTIYARELLDRGLIAFDELRQAVKHFEFLANPAEGELRIGLQALPHARASWANRCTQKRRIGLMSLAS